MSEYILAAKITADATQAEGELKKLNDKLKSLKEVQAEFIKIFGDGAPEVAAIGSAIAEVEKTINKAITTTAALNNEMAGVSDPLTDLNAELKKTESGLSDVIKKTNEIPAVEIPVTVGDVPEIPPVEIPAVEIPVTVGDVPPVDPGEIPAVEIPVTVGDVPPIDPGEIPAVEIPVTVGDVPPIDPGAVPPVEIPVTVGDIPPIDPGAVPPVEIPVTVGDVPPVDPGAVPPVEIPVTVGDVPEIPVPDVPTVEIPVTVNETGGGVEDLTNKLTEISKPVDLLNESLKKTESELAAAIKQFGKGSPEADKLSKKVSVLQSAISKLDDPIKEFTKEIDKSGKQIDQAAKSFTAIPKNANDAEQAVDNLADAEKKLADNSGAAAKGTKNLGESAQGAEKKVDKLGDSLEKSGKQAKESGKSTGGLLTMLKAGGIIGAASAAFDLFKNSLMKNQKVADTVATVMTTIENVMSAIVDVVVNVTEKVGENTGGFDALGKVLSGIVKFSMQPLRIIIAGIALFINEAQLAWEQSFFGDDDPETIKKLTASIEQQKATIADAAEQMVESGTQIVENLGDALNEAGQLVQGVVEGISEINVSAIYDSAKATTELKNNAKIAAAQLAGVVEQYGAQAERLRQIRDDDRKSIAERISANEELGRVLEKQQAAQLALVDSKVNAAQAELNANKGNLDLQTALIEAQNERKAVLNQIAGFQSEQLANEKALALEALALAKATAQAENENYLTRKKNAAELITDELKKNETLQAIRNEERALELQRLRETVNQYAEGTQARLDAETELQNKINELDQQDAQAKQERENIKIQRSNETKNAIIANATAETALKKQLLDSEGSTLLKKSERKLAILREESKNVISQLEAQRDQEIAEAEKAGKSTVEIKQKYATAISAVNVQLLQSEKELAVAILEENQRRAQEIFKVIEQSVQFYSSLMDIQLDKVQRRQDREVKQQDQLLKDKKINQEQYEKNVNSINQKAEKDKIKIQKRQIIADKAVGIAQIIMNTIQANMKSVAQFPLTAGQPWVTINTIMGALGVANTVAQAARALQALGSGGGGGESGGSGTVPTSSAPVAPVMGSTTLNPAQVNDMVTSRAEPVRAYVVESDVRNNQERIDRINRAATIG